MVTDVAAPALPAAGLDLDVAQVTSRLLTLTGAGWVLLADRRWPASSVERPGLILVGPPGIFAVEIHGRGGAAGLLRFIDQIADAVAAEHVTPSAVVPLLVEVGRTAVNRVGRLWQAGESTVISLLTRLPRRLGSDAVTAVAGRLASTFSSYEEQSAPAGPDSDVDDMSDNVALEPWMTFLHPDQLALVRRAFGGPARISGAPGTGKTVVGLHRAAYLAQRVEGPILYTSGARSLPQVQSLLFQQFAPGLADRVEFTGLHEWAERLLAERGTSVQVDDAEECFAAAWERFGHGLELLEPDPRYWKDEIAYVIKGRGVADLETYLELSRPGRKMPLQRPVRHAVWELLEAYEGIKKQRELVDHADLIQEALDELRREPVRPGYAAVIADEVQDLSVTAVTLLHTLIGDGPNGLLLIGDGQQSVYPVGFPLHEANISIRGARSETLRRNYRNGGPILRAALKVAATTPSEDPDAIRPDVEATVQDGQIVHVVTPSNAALDRALLKMVHDLAEVRPGKLRGVAVLCARTAEVDHFANLLAEAGIAIQPVEAGSGGAAVTVASVRRAKGLEFDIVLLPRFNQALDTATGAAASDRVALANRELYVAMTRARQLLWLGEVRPPVRLGSSPAAPARQSSR